TGGTMSRWMAVLLLSIGPLACNDGKVGGNGGSGGTGGIGGANAGPSITQHHNNPSRDGVYIVPGLTRAAAASMHRDTRVNATFDGSSAAQPLYVEGAGGSDPDRVIVATLTNHVTAFDAESGATLWDRTLGTPAPRACSSGAATSGIVGTPVIDLPRRILYVN